MNYAIILASGMGKRMQMQKNKVLVTLHRKPLIYWSLRTFEKVSEIEKIVVTSRPGEIEELEKIVRKNRFKKVVKILAGGAERQYSAQIGLKWIIEELKPQKKAVIIFHNGANPFVSSEEIKQTILATQEIGAAAVALPTTDTIKEVDEKNLVVKTLDRKKLWNMQTPQGLRLDWAKKAFFQAEKDGFLGTDDISLAERLGKRAKIILASPLNFKITRPLDLELAKIIFKKKLCSE